MGTKLLKQWDLYKKRDRGKFWASSSYLCLETKVVENMCIFIKCSQKKYDRDIKKRETAINLMSKVAS